ncbi:hypothetical protein H0E84_11175 [Luteimonas sp. SJ-92]|uniref:Uncharacterized protein n=1 Tax=Luteimonas salinisoli TaxID=2752307 RepID=A0A853JCF7_9GAMM|nr:hypothetical protein [Luteimonas salinisoli]NZA26943.1 hypothetical protein [Luteimonas salinisoli]
MTQASNNVTDSAIKLFWTLLFSLGPAILLGMDFGLSVGLGYFVIAAVVISVHYDAQDVRKAVQQLTQNRQA